MHRSIILSHHTTRWPSEPPHVDVDAPTLICHIAFWKPFAPQTDDRPRRLTVINNLLDSIHQQYGHTLAQRLDAPGHASVVSIPPWHSMEVTLRFELHKEIVSLAIYIRAKRTNDTDNDPVAKNIIDSLANLNAIIDGAHPSMLLADMYSCLYDDAWIKFFNDNNKLDPYKKFNFNHDIDDAELISDVRGLILVSSFCSDCDRTITALHPFLCCSTITSLDNYTICQMMDKKVLHFSALAKPDKTNPHYMVCANSGSINSMDLGNLVETGNRLIVSRLAAIRAARDFPVLSDVIRKIAVECSCIRRSFSDNVPIEQIHERMRKLSAGLFVQLENLCVGDPNYRLHMVEKHKNDFDSNCTELAISSVMTYKQYDKYTTGVLLPNVKWARKLLHKYNQCIEQYADLQSMATEVATSVSAGVTAKKNTTIEKLQETAELFLFIALVPYYLGNAITETAEAVCDAFHLSKPPIFDAAAWAFVWAGGLWLALESVAKWDSEERYVKSARATVATLKGAPPDCVKGWFERSLRSSAVWAWGVILFAVLWSFVVIHFQPFERLLS